VLGWAGTCPVIVIDAKPADASRPYIGHTDIQRDFRGAHAPKVCRSNLEGGKDWQRENASQGENKAQNLHETSPWLIADTSPSTRIQRKNKNFN
jgi:hypothetical protein